MRRRHHRTRPALRPASRLALRTVSVAIVLVGLAGGLTVEDLDGHLRGAFNAQQSEVSAEAELQTMRARTAEWLNATVGERATRDRTTAQAQLIAEEWARRVAQAEKEASRLGADRELAFGPIPPSCDGYIGNRAIGCALVLEAGFGVDQMSCLDHLWTKESGWNHRSRNVSSGAYGIPQALPGSKMAQFGDDWETNPATQIKWGLNYIENRYGTPCRAWQHSVDFNWY